MTLIYIRISVQ